MNQPPYPSHPPPPGGQWGGPPQGYPPQGYPAQAPPLGGGPPGKKPFRFQMWMLGAAIVPIGIGFAVRDVMMKGSIELGGECSDSDHCKSHTCLSGGGGICTQTCSALSPCPAGFACEAVNVTLKNQGGFHNLGTQMYCMHPAPGSAASKPSASVSASAPSAAATPAPSAAPPPEVASAAAKPAAAATAAPKKPAAKPKPKK